MIFEDRYGFFDRLLHRIAFRAGIAQRAMADVEALLYGDALPPPTRGVPVFITGLPRAGTTILLNLLWATGRFASHTYEDMPFVLCPLLWRRFSSSFTVDSAPRERAHGDGLTVSGKSPEAFEEMIWKEFWPGHYQSDRILPWAGSDRNREFDDFLELHMRKIVALRREDRPSATRYLSKNNANIARLALAAGPLNRGIFVVPFREPMQQAASMLRQHRRFLEIHAENDFVRRYMEAIGHHEFGKELRPIDFEGWSSKAPDPGRLEFWVRYWVVAYSHVLEHLDPSSVLVSYDRLTADPEAALARLEDLLGVRRSDLVSHASDVRSPRTHDVEPGGVRPLTLDEASALYRRLTDEARV